MAKNRSGKSKDKSKIKSEGKGLKAKTGKGKGKGKGNKTAQTAQKPLGGAYRMTNYTKILEFETVDDSDTSRFLPGKKEMTFESEFEVEEQVTRSTNSSGAVMTLYGNFTDAAVIKLTVSCPNLIHLDLKFDSLTGAALSSVFTDCSKIQFIGFSTDVQVCGKLKGTAFDELRENPELAKDLLEMQLEGQKAQSPIFNTAIKRLSEARKDLCIETGDWMAIKWSHCLGGEEPSEDNSLDDDNEGIDYFDDDSETDFMDDIQFMNSMMLDSALGDFVMNQYANGNDMGRYMGGYGF